MRTILDRDLRWWEVYATTGDFGSANPAKVAFRCTSDAWQRPRVFLFPGRQVGRRENGRSGVGREAGADAGGGAERRVREVSRQHDTAETTPPTHLRGATFLAFYVKAQKGPAKRHP